MEKLELELAVLINAISDTLFEQYNKRISITSGFRDKSNPYYSAKSYHSFGLAVDFTLVEEDIFEWVYYVIQVTKNWEMNGYTVREFEVVQDKKDQDKCHCHVAIDKGKETLYFTAEY